jgi:hypothetical protein
MTIMIRPSFEAGRTTKATDLPRKKSRKYFEKGLDRFQVICPAGCFVAGRRIGSSLRNDANQWAMTPMSSLFGSAGVRW